MLSTQIKSYTSISTPKQSLNTSKESFDTKSNIGQYEILNDLGEGTFGSVKLGKHISKGNLVAIKILEKSRIRDQADIDRVV